MNYEYYIDKTFFLDIETVPFRASFDKLSESEKTLWEEKSRRVYPEETPENSYSHAGIFAEFGKIVCICFGIIKKSENDFILEVYSCTGKEEKALLEGFSKILSRFHQDHWHLCAHNGKEFDFPYLCRRMLANRIKLPKILNIQGVKPWDVRHFDTLHLWRFGDFKNYTSLKTLCQVFDIKSPKEEIEGSMIHSAYWKEDNIKGIVKYCREDVRALAEVFLRICCPTVLNELITQQERDFIF